MIEFLKEHPLALIGAKIAIIALLTYVIAWIAKMIWRRNANNQQNLFRKFIFHIIRALIYLTGLLLCIGQIPQLSKVLSTILAGSGILALALSLSAQESLNNVISGMFITLFKPFEIGDRVTLASSGLTGTIEDITLRHTIVKTFTNTRVVVPNATMNKEIIENSNLIDARASSFVDVEVAYESDIEQAMELMADVIASHPYYWDVRTEEEMETVPKVKVYIRSLGERGVSLRANMWTKTVSENFEACSDVRLGIKRAFDRAGIEIPYTKYTILHQKSKVEELDREEEEEKA